MSFSQKKHVSLLLVCVTTLLCACKSGNPLVDRQLELRQQRVARTLQIAVDSEQSRPAKLTRTEAVVAREWARRLDRFNQLPHNWMLWWVFV